jgi:carbonic anhydrase/acetyltransferase-like protein (isoleucine patch superfamily)
MYKIPGIYPLLQTIYHNPPVAEAPHICYPSISEHAVIGESSMVIGDVMVSEHVFIGFHNIIRADASPPFYIGPCTNIQDFVLIHCHPGDYIDVGGRNVGVYIEGNVSILHHAAPHGPLFVGENTFIGQHCSIYDAIIGRNCVIMHGAVITNKVKIADNRFVAPGQSVWKQEEADALPEVPEKYKNLNAQIVDYYYRLGKSYKAHTPLAF